jgi:signal peptidase I
MSAMTASTGVSVGRALRVPLPRGLQWTFALVVLAFAAVLGFARFGLHMTASSVLTGSMRPSFAPGDAVITRPVPISSVHPGMVILATPDGRSAPYAHRIIAVKHENGEVLVQTRGDANPAPDEWRDVYAPTAKVAEVVGTVPKLGYLLEAIHGRTTQRGVVPVGVAGTFLTFALCAFILFAGPPRRRGLAD